MGVCQLLAQASLAPVIMYRKATRQGFLRTGPKAKGPTNVEMEDASRHGEESQRSFSS